MTMLSDEVIYFYERIYSKSPKDQLVEQYNLVHRCYEELHSKNDQDWINSLITKNVNIIPLEFYLRVIQKGKLLTKKMQVITYLAECDSENFNLYYNSKQIKFSFFKIIYLGIQSLYLFSYGFFLSVFYGPK